MSERPPLDLDAITARARKAEVDTVNSLRHDVAAVIDALVGDSLALVARIRALEKVAEAAAALAESRDIIWSATKPSEEAAWRKLKAALAEAGYEK